MVSKVKEVSHKADSPKAESDNLSKIKKNMKKASEQSMTQGAIEATEAAIVAAREAGGPTKRGRPAHAVPKASESGLYQPTFDWKAQGECNELNNFKTEVRKMFSR